jgi:hypothetical protein
MGLFKRRANVLYYIAGNQGFVPHQIGGNISSQTM